jgi:zinc-finger-containing domain
MTAVRRKIPCADCARMFRNEQGLQDHRRIVHGMIVESLPEGRRPTLNEISPNCLECGQLAQLVGGQSVYPHRPDLYGKHFYLCECGAYCGCHPGSVVPLGYPAGYETRNARKAAHAAFDPLWKSGEMTRQSAYAWLTEATSIPNAQCHVGMMTRDQALSVVRAVRDRSVAERQAA